MSLPSTQSTRPAHSTGRRHRRCRKVASLSFLTLILTAATVHSFTLPSQSTLASKTFVSATRSSSTSASRISYASPGLADVITASSISVTEAPPGWKDRWIPKVVRRTRPREEVDYERRKEEWAAKYSSVDALREMFGDNENKVWGDLDATTSRRLYKTLLPRALIQLYKVGVHPEDLAPLAYKARVAAKLYARERCAVPPRLLAMGYDGVRQWKRYGKFNPNGMSYDQVWQKYKALILEEEENLEDLTERDVTAKICLKILERSCETNSLVDKLFLKGRPHDYDYAAKQEEYQDISILTEQLEKDVRSILDEAAGKEPAKELTAQQYRALRMVARAKRRMEDFKNKNHHHHPDLHHDHTSPKTELPVRRLKERTRKTANRHRPWEDRQPPSPKQ